MRQRMPRSEPLMVGWDRKRDGEGEGRMEERKLEDFPDQTSSGQSICENGVVQILGCCSQTKEHHPQNFFNCRWPQPPDCNRHLNNINPKSEISCKQFQLQKGIILNWHQLLNRINAKLLSTVNSLKSKMPLTSTDIILETSSIPKYYQLQMAWTPKRHQPQNVISCRWPQP